ncbi:MAG: hypothetical protein HAW67_06085 [Endozoicomonadaceae bacterium]|nr:hypothetical protein [Endozoicomonadaceae bacterium]
MKKLQSCSINTIISIASIFIMPTMANAVIYQGKNIDNHVYKCSITEHKGVGRIHDYNNKECIFNGTILTAVIDNAKSFKFKVSPIIYSGIFKFQKANDPLWWEVFIGMKSFKPNNFNQNNI